LNGIDTTIFWGDSAYFSAFAFFGLEAAKRLQSIMAVSIFD
jgi:hypothetical protein